MGLERITYTGGVAARLLGPGAVVIGQDTYKSDLTKTYIQLTLLHSFPTVNTNGMTFTPPLLAKAVPTANNQPLNLDHQLEGNPEEVYQGEDQIVGSMIKAYLANTGEISLLPESAVPVKVIGVLWNRTSLAQKIIKSIGQGEKQYRVSFELIRDVAEDGWIIIDGEGKPSYEAEISEDLFEAWKNREYGRVALAVGGDGKGNSTNFWGGAFTLIPADETTEIDEILTASFAGGMAIAAHMEGKIDPAYAKVIPYKSFPKAEEGAAWSFKAADGNKLLGENGDNWPRYRSVHSWYDNEKPKIKGSYKLPVAKEVDGIIKVFWHGVRAAMGIILGARGGIKTSVYNKKAIYNRLKKYYKDFGKEVPEFGSYTDAQLIAMGFDMAEIASCLGAINKEVNTMSLTSLAKAALAKIQAAIAQGGFSLQVAGDQLTLTLGENVIKQPDDFSLYGYRRSDGEYALRASMEIAKGGIDGFKEKVRLEYTPDADGEAESMVPVEEGAEKVKTPKMYDAQILALMETIKNNTKTEEQVRGEYAKHLSPEDHQKAVNVAVTKALADAGKDNLFTEEQLNSKVQKAVDDILKARDLAEGVAKVRGEKIKAEGFTLTKDRKSHIATFAVDEAGDTAFTAWVKKLKDNQSEMLEALKAENIEVTDNIKAALACVNSKEDSGFVALIASQGGSEQKIFTPSMGAGGSPETGQNEAEGCF